MVASGSTPTRTLGPSLVSAVQGGSRETGEGAEKSHGNDSRDGNLPCKGRCKMLNLFCLSEKRPRSDRITDFKDLLGEQTLDNHLVDEGRTRSTGWG